MSNGMESPLRAGIKSLGLVFGDIGTSPIYTLTVIFLLLERTPANITDVLYPFSLHGLQEPKICRQGKKNHERVKHGQGAVQAPGNHPQQQEGDNSADLFIFRPEGSCQPHGERHGTETKKGRCQPGGPGVYSEKPPADLDEPEQERRLVAVRHAIDMRDEKLITLPHLPGHGEVAGFIDWQRRSGNKSGTYQPCPEQEPQYRVFQAISWHGAFKRTSCLMK